MKITPEQVQHVARLARLDVDDDEVETFSRQLSAILDYVDALGQVDTEGVTPTSHAISLTNAFREDRVVESFAPEDILENAPESEGTEFIVPKIIN
ncbi:MAG: Asp-tRNA(Asn)/Glu-tRNA(Gln) amidotransferase subunit GatC [Desulfatibacillaceae bacterium]